MMDFSSIKPKIVNDKSGNQIKRYNAKISKVGSDEKINVGVTPSGTLFYRHIEQNKSIGSVYMKKYDGTEVFADTFKTRDYTKAIVERRKDGLVTGGKRVVRYNVPGSINQVGEYEQIGKRSKYIVSKDIEVCLIDLKNSVDMTGLKPKGGKLKKLLKLIAKNLAL